MKRSCHHNLHSQTAEAQASHLLPHTSGTKLAARWMARPSTYIFKKSNLERNGPRSPVEVEAVENGSMRLFKTSGMFQMELKFPHRYFLFGLFTNLERSRVSIGDDVVTCTLLLRLFAFDLLISRCQISLSLTKL
jgi:hypothetical protein